MPHIGIRVEDELKDEIKRKANLTSRSVSDYIIDLVKADLGNIENEEDDLWITNAAYNFDLTVKQIKYSIDTAQSAAEAITQIGAKSKWYKVFVGYEGEELEAQIESLSQSREIYIVSTSRRQAKINIVKDIFKKFDKEIAGGAV